jgi:hypothetical protein
MKSQYYNYVGGIIILIGGFFIYKHYSDKK